jgi:hypothetical protein
VTALDGAITTFTDAIKTGTMADKTALNAAITAAEQAKASATVNTAAENVPEETYWVTQAVMTALENAITAAKAVADNAALEDKPADNTTIANAKTAIENATTTFIAAKQAGTKIVRGGTITITIENPTEQVLAVSGVPSTEQSRRAGDSFTLSITTGNTVAWQVDGVVKTGTVSGEETKTLTINAADYPQGIHNILVLVTISGKTYTKEIALTVIRETGGAE